MERQEKIDAVLLAVRNGKVSKRQIDIKGKGKAVKKLESGDMISEEKLEEMYSALQALGKIGNKLDNKSQELGNERKLGNKLGKKYPLLGNGEKEIRQKLDNLERENTALKASLFLLTERVSALENRLGNQTTELDKKLDIGQPDPREELDKKIEPLAKNVLGFTVTEKEMKGGKKYWYGAKNDDGKTLWAYIGKDRSKAEEKIRDWVLKHRPDLLPQ